ncbi:MAG TPA: thioredoxin domain-containing protein [Anaerolineae bacterium]
MIEKNFVDIEQIESVSPEPFIEPGHPAPAEAEAAINLETDEWVEDETIDWGGEKEELFPRSWVLLLVGLLVGGLGGFYLRPALLPEPELTLAPLAAVEASDQINLPDPHQAVMLAVIGGARHFYGDPNAPITIVEFGDFNCGYCGRWAREVLPRINEEFIDTGLVRMAYIHYPILGADSMTAAEATECAAEQDRFWDYHNAAYDHQGIGFTPENLIKLAEALELDIAAFEACLTNFSDRLSLEDDIRLAQIMGVRGTPAFLVNAVPLAGAHPFEDFQQIIERTLVGEFQ